MRRASTLVLLFAVCAYFFWPLYYERGQCARKCKWVNSKSKMDLNITEIDGHLMDFWNTDKCICLNTTDPSYQLPVSETSRLNQYKDFKWHYEEDVVCKINDEIINCGVCGKCSKLSTIILANIIICL